MQIHGVDLAAAVGRVVIDAALRVPAGGVDRILKLAGPYLAAALLLLDRAEDVEELPDALRFALAGARIGPDERRAHEARAGAEIARQAQRAHAAAECGKLQLIGEPVFRLTRREAHVAVQTKVLDGEGRIVRQDALRAVVDVQAVRHGLDHECARPVRHEPVELRGREVGAERCADQVQLCQRRPHLRETGAAAQQPRNEFELRHVYGHGLQRRIRRVADEVQPGHAEPLLIDRVVVERIAVRDAGRADDGIVLRTEAFVPKLERIGARRHNDFLAVAALIVERPAHVKIAGQIGQRRTHRKPSRCCACSQFLRKRRILSAVS